jgi:hypothetical protein
MIIGEEGVVGGRGHWGRFAGEREIGREGARARVLRQTTVEQTKLRGVEPVQRGGGRKRGR